MNFCLLLKIWVIGKNISKNLSGKYSQELLDHANNLLLMHLKLSQKELLKKQQKQLVIWLVIKLQIELWKSLKISPPNSLETVKNELDKEIPKKRYISPEDRKKIIDDLSL